MSIPESVKELAKLYDVKTVSNMTGYSIPGLRGYARRNGFEFVAIRKRIDIELVRKLLRRKYTMKQIAAYTGRTYLSIRSLILRNRLKVLAWDKRPVTKNTRKVIGRMASNGIPIWYIAMTTGRSYDTIRTMCQKLRVVHPYHLKGRNDVVGLPPTEDEIRDNKHKVVSTLRTKYPRTPVEDIVSAVNLATAELVQQPKRDTWLALWRTIAQRRLVDDIREVTGRRDGTKLPKGERELLTDNTAEASIDPLTAVSDDIEAVRTAVSKLPDELRLLMNTLLDNDYSKKRTAHVLGVSESTVYTQLALVFPLLKEILCDVYQS